MRRLGLALGLAVLHFLHGADAHACGPTPFMLSALLPLENQSDVGIDAALIASVNYQGPLAFELRRVGDGEDSNPAGVVDGGTTPGAGDPDSSAVAVDVECHEATWGGHFCVAKPTSALEPSTQYEWSAAVEIGEGQDPGYFAPTPWRKFTTSNRVTVSQAITLEARVQKNNRFLDPLCGIDHLVEVAVNVSRIEMPVVLNAWGVTPSYVMEPLVLTADTSKFTWSLYGPPECVQLEAWDGAGKRTDILELCPDEQLPATYYDGLGNVAPAPTDEAGVNDSPTSEAASQDTRPANELEGDGDHVQQHGIDNGSATGCAHVPPNASSLRLGWLMAGLVVVAWRRRQHR